MGKHLCRQQSVSATMCPRLPGSLDEAVGITAVILF